MSPLFPSHTPAWETEEHAVFRKHVAAFFAKELVPHQERFAEQHQVDRELWTKAGDAGLLCPELPEEQGGSGGDFGHEAVLAQELAAVGDTSFALGVHSTIVAHYIANCGTEEQKRRWLPGIASGRSVLAIAMTEPGAGSDLQAIRTTAARDGDWYVVNGSKTFITNGTHCDLLVLVAKTDSAEGARGVSLLVLETKDLPGFSRGRVLRKLGQHGQDTRELFFDNVRVPAANLLGGTEGQGFYQLMNQLPRERLIIGLGGIAAAEAAVVETVRYVKERTVFGKPLLEFQNTRFVLAECKAEVLALNALADQAIAQAIAGELDATTASAVKLVGTERQGQIVDKCLQLFGGYGYMAEYPIAQMYADARVQRIYGGTSEVMKELIARSL